MKRRLHIVQALEKNRLTTGSVVQMMEAVRGLRSRGHRVTVVSRSGGDLEAACADCGADFLTLPLRHPFDLASIRGLRRFLRSRCVHLIHVYKGTPHAIALFAATRLGRQPALVVNRGVSFALTRANRLKYRHPRVGAVVCVAGVIRRSVIESAGVDPCIARTIHSGTDVERFDPARVSGQRVRAELGLDEQDVLVGTVSTRQWKGWRDVLAAASMIAPGEQRLRLLIVGCEPDRERLKVVEEARIAGLADRVHTMPFRSDMPEVLRACDLVVDASTSGTGITGTIREAMALERLVVATDCGGNGELVVDGESGLLVPPGDSGALADAMSKLMWDVDLSRGMGATARRRVLEGFTTNHRVDRLEELYYAIADEGDEPP